MDLTNRISRSEIAEQLRVQTQTIAKWERIGTFPQAKEKLTKIRRIKDGMMQELLTGRIRLVDAKKAPELELVQSG